MIDCAIIIVAYKSASDLPALLASLATAAGPLSWRAVIVDNYSLDNLQELVGHHPRVTLVQTGANLGYSGGLNVGVRNAPESRFTVFLNPDLVMEPGSLVALVDACSPDDIAASVPLVTDENGEPQPSLRREPSNSRALGEAFFGDRWARRPSWLAEMIRDPSRYRTASTIDWATGAALVVSASAVNRVGDWDAGRFFLYSEETDYSRRIRATGHRIWFTPAAVVRHRGAGSGSSAELEALLAVNKLRYYRKWHGPVPTAAFFAISVAHNVLRLERAGSRAALRALFSSRARAALPGGVK
jgi:N-acetylglucosaminyl-diphospho-decaprenol L-rhamnosyltransferase